MKSIQNSVGIWVFLLSGSLSMACGGASQNGPLQLAPSYRPTASLELHQLSGAILSTPIRIGDVVDTRPEPRDAVGRSLEEGEPISVTTSSVDLVAMFRKAIDVNLREAGLQVVETADTALNFQIVRAWVEEDGVYRGEVRLKVLVEKNGTTTGEMLVGGTAKRWGATLSPDNYEEVLSDSLIDSMVNLLNMNELNQALATTPTADSVGDGSSGTDVVGGMVE